MGREARQKKAAAPARPQPITLDPADYWKLKSLIGDVRMAREKAAQLVTVASQAHDAHVKVLAAKHPNLPTSGQFRLDDASCALVPEAQ